MKRGFHIFPPSRSPFSITPLSPVWFRGCRALSFLLHTLLSLWFALRALYSAFPRPPPTVVVLGIPETPKSRPLCQKAYGVVLFTPAGSPVAADSRGAPGTLGETNREAITVTP